MCAGSSKSGGGSPASSSRSSGGRNGRLMHVYTCTSRVRFGQVTERGDVLRRAGGAQQLGAEAPGLGRDHLDGIALGGDADDPPLVLLQHGHDLRQLLDSP